MLDVASLLILLVVLIGRVYGASRAPSLASDASLSLLSAAAVNTGNSMI